MGEYENYRDRSIKRPVLCCIGGALSGITCVFSGTSFSLSEFDQATVPNVGRFASAIHFSTMPRMGTPRDVKNMMERFNIRVAEEKVSDELLELLTGRCQFVARAITEIIREHLKNLLTSTTDRKAMADIVRDAITDVQKNLAEQMATRRQEGSGDRSLVQNFFVNTLLGKGKTYIKLTAFEKKWVDEFFVWITGKPQTTQLNEPILVRAARQAF